MLWIPSESSPAPVRPPPPVSILTVLQPVASAMVTPDAGGYGDDGGFVPVKPIENRGWRAGGTRGIPRGGLLVAIHAGSRWWPAFATRPVSGLAPETLAWVRERWPGMPDPAEIPRSAVIGCVRVRATVRTTGPAPMFADTGSWERIAFGSCWTLGPVAWVVDRAWEIEPIPWTAGGLTLTAAPASIAAACLAAGACLADDASQTDRGR